MRGYLKALLALLLLSNVCFAKSDCDGKIFSSLSVGKGATIAQLLESLSSRCYFSVVVKDEKAEQIVSSKKLNTINLKEFTLQNILDFILIENGLDYEYKNEILKLYSYSTKTFKVDYITAVRSAETKFLLGNGGGSSAAATATTGQQGIPNYTSSVGSTFTANDNDARFWESIRKDLDGILDPHKIILEHTVKREVEKESGAAYATDKDKAAISDTKTASTQAIRSNIIINPQAGLITITATKSKLKEAEEYIKVVMDRLHKQVLIDVQILEVTINNGQTTGIDWNQIYNLQNINLRYGSNLDKVNSSDLTGVIADSFSRAGSIAISGGIDIKDIIKFLKTQGNVKSISNPKLLTLNNQPALITSGDVIFYPKVSGGTNATATSGATNPSVETVSLPVGVTLDITPEIIDESHVMLKINPTSSSCKIKDCPLQPVRISSTLYDIAPNIVQKQISSVIKAADGDRVILGGLIQEVSNANTTKLPLAGDIPLLG
ncbi:MAG TPA: hypothetical protein PLV58_06610, partial [Campylobacterales bacterium]|nr:hypothetical protein [Campylobacterales bacterium]